jgi:hypothetical protein
MHLNRSRLVRSLSALSANDSAAPRPNLTERLGQWVGVGDAMALFSALQPGPGRQAAGLPGCCPADPSYLVTETARLQQELAQLRSTLGKAIRADALFKPVKPVQRARLPGDTPGDTPGNEQGAPDYAGSDAAFEAAFEADFLPYRRACLLHQRTLATRIGAWRPGSGRRWPTAPPHCKSSPPSTPRWSRPWPTASATCCPPCPRCSKNASMPCSRAGSKRPQNPHAHANGTWLTQFRSEVQEVLLAELDLRLQPAEGLIAACLAETHQHHPSRNDPPSHEQTHLHCRLYCRPAGAALDRRRLPHRPTRWP